MSVRQGLRRAQSERVLAQILIHEHSGGAVLLVQPNYLTAAGGAWVGIVAYIAVVNQHERDVVGQELCVVLVGEPGIDIRRDEAEVAVLSKPPQNIAAAFSVFVINFD